MELLQLCGATRQARMSHNSSRHKHCTIIASTSNAAAAPLQTEHTAASQALFADTAAGIRVA